MVYSSTALICSAVTISIRTLKDAAGQIADGDLTGQLPESRGKDELDDLSRSFGIMTHNIRGIIQSIGEAGHRVDLMAQDIDRGNDTAQAIVQQVSRVSATGCTSRSGCIEKRRQCHRCRHCNCGSTHGAGANVQIRRYTRISFVFLEKP